MALLEEKLFDIIISLTVMFLGLVLGVIIDAIRNKKEVTIINNSPSHRTNVSVTSITNVEQRYNDENGKKEKANKKESDDVIQLKEIFGIATITLSIIGYLFFREQALRIITYMVLLALSISLGSILHPICKGYYKDFKWVFYTAFTLLFCFTSLFLVNTALSPSHAPENFKFSQQIINQYGIKGIFRYFSSYDLLWVVFHLLGVLLLFFANFNMVLSSLTRMTDHLLKRRPAKAWIERIIKQYENFFKTSGYISIFLIASYLLINGNAYDWVVHKLPVHMREIIETIVNGRV